MTNKIIDYEQFIKDFVPIKNTLVEDAAFDGYMFETFGAEWDFVRENLATKVWTIVSEGHEMMILPGFHVVNRLGYMICTNPNDDFSIVVDLQEYHSLDEVIAVCQKVAIGVFKVQISRAFLSEHLTVDPSLNQAQLSTTEAREVIEKFFRNYISDEDVETLFDEMTDTMSDLGLN